MQTWGRAMPCPLQESRWGHLGWRAKPLPPGKVHAAASAIKLAKDKEEVDHSNEFFEARENGTGPLDKKYERVPPEHFATGSDDLFMKSMIMNYAQEGKDIR